MTLITWPDSNRSEPINFFEWRLREGGHIAAGGHVAAGDHVAARRGRGEGERHLSRAFGGKIQQILLIICKIKHLLNVNEGIGIQRFKLYVN